MITIKNVVVLESRVHGVQRHAPQDIGCIASLDSDFLELEDFRNFFKTFLYLLSCMSRLFNYYIMMGRK